jgi:hypothetical protein
MIHAEFVKKLLNRWDYTDIEFEESEQETFASVIPLGRD